MFTMFTPAPLQIVLNIYDIHQSNSVLYSVGAGFYHTGVEVNGYEYSFSTNGVVRTRPQLPDFGTLRERKPMGTYTQGMSGINAVISTLRNSRFQHGAYDPIHLNCNHFSDAFCQATVHQAIPAWINRMAGMGAMASTSKPVASTEKMAAPGVVKSPEMPVALSKAKIPDATMNSKRSEPEPESELFSQSIFSWFGWGGADSKTVVGQPAVRTPEAEVASVSVAATAPSGKKKGLTDKQKELLAKMKS